MDTEYFTPADLVTRYMGKVSERTLANWRSAGTSPPFTKIGGRILYPKQGVVEWEKRRTVSTTGNYKK